MKEQILRLEPHDDFVSARDRIGWAQTARLLLVWPRQGGVLNRRLDLVLLSRHAGRLGARLALVSADPAVRENGRELGLPVFSTLAEARGARWRARPRGGSAGRATAAPRPGPRPRLSPEALRAEAARRPHPWPAWLAWTLRWLVFVLAVASLSVAALAVLPAATIGVTPSIRPLEVTLDLTADPGIDSGDGDRIPARQVRVEVEAQGRINTTGLREVPSQPAVGSVVFTSLDGLVTVIPQGTGVRTTSGQPVRFRTRRPAGLEPRIGAAVDVAVEAVDLGPAGNVASGKINAIDGPLGLQLAVINPGPTSGGASAQRPAVTANDRASLGAEVLAQLESQALGAIESQLQPGEFLAADSVRVASIVAETYDATVGEQAATLGLTLRVAFSGLAASETDALRAAEAALAAAVPAGERLLAGRSRYERQPELWLDEAGRPHVVIIARGATQPVIDREAVRAGITGLEPAQAQAELSRRWPLAEPPQITLWPNWFPRLPYTPFRINVAIAAEDS